LSIKLSTVITSAAKWLIKVNVEASVTVGRVPENKDPGPSRAEAVGFMAQPRAIGDDHDGVGWQATHKPADVLPSHLRLGSRPGVGSTITRAARFLRLCNNSVGDVRGWGAGPRTLPNVPNGVQKSHNEDSLVEVGARDIREGEEKEREGSVKDSGEEIRVGGANLLENDNGLANGRTTCRENVADIVAVGIVSGITKVTRMLTRV
jgi:hypothetical protein